MNDRQAPIRRNPREVHDFWPRVLASPFLGALVVNLSGLIDHARHSTAELVASYGWFALVAFVVWEGNRRLYFRLPRREDWLLRPWSRLGVLLALISLYTIPMSLALLWTWRDVTGDPGTRHYALTTAIFAVVASSWRSPMSTRPCSCCATGRATASAAPGSNRPASRPSWRVSAARSTRISSSTT